MFKLLVMCLVNLIKYIMVINCKFTMRKSSANIILMVTEETCKRLESQVTYKFYDFASRVKRRMQNFLERNKSKGDISLRSSAQHHNN